MGWRTTLPLILLGSIGYAGQSTLYFASLERNPASINSILLYAYPVFVALLSWIVDRASPSRREFGALLLASVGVVLTVSGDVTPRSLSSTVDPFGVALVLASAAWYAAYIVVSDRFVHSVGPWVSTTWIALGAGLSFALVGTLTRSLDFALDPQTWLILVGIVLFSTILALGTFLAGMSRVGPTVASLLSTLEPVFTVILAMLLLREVLSSFQFLGAAFVLSAVILLTLPEKVRP
jgi:drug/metabolite transporter (DMT)-like permease